MTQKKNSKTGGSFPHTTKNVGWKSMQKDKNRKVHVVIETMIV